MLAITFKGVDLVYGWNIQRVPRSCFIIYIIRVSLADTAVSCVYVFLTRKDQDTYEEMLRQLASRALQKRFLSRPGGGRHRF